MEDEKKSEEQNEEDFVYSEEAGNDAKTILEKLRKKLKECHAEKQKYLDGWQRTQADFANFRRRQEGQFSEWSKALGEELLKDILPVLDSLEAGIMNKESGIKNLELELIKKQLADILRRHGLEEIKAIGEKFNPQFHEVIECEETKEHSDEIVAAEIQKGYILNGKVIRAAKVKVKK